jgi:hypothetical protein
MNGTALAPLFRRLAVAGSRRAAVQTLVVGGLSALGVQGRHGTADARDRCPRGKVRTIAGPPKRIEVTFQAEKGLTSLVVTRSENADTVVPPFIPGTTDTVVMSSTKIDQTQRARVQVQSTNGPGVTRTCNVTF